MTKKKAEKKRKASHGGRREGTGRPAIFRGKSATAADPLHGEPPNPVSFLPSTAALAIIDTSRASLAASLKVAKVSRSDYLEALNRLKGLSLTAADFRKVSDEPIDGIGVTYLPTHGGLAIVETVREKMHAELKKKISRSRYLEVLVRTYGKSVTSTQIKALMAG